MFRAGRFIFTDGSKRKCRYFAKCVEGQEHDRKLVLGCELLIDRVEQCRELSIVSVSGDADAVADFNATVKFNDSEPLRNDTSYEDKRMFDVADGMGRAILHASIKDEYPELVVVRRCA